MIVKAVSSCSVLEYCISIILLKCTKHVPETASRHFTPPDSVIYQDTVAYGHTEAPSLH